jgi:GT2 family glycosyltransferase
MAALIAGAAPELEGPEGLRVAKGLHAIRDAARGELPALTAEQGAALGANVDAILTVDERAAWVFGWAHDPGGLIDRLELVSPEGQRVDLLNGAYRYARADVAEVQAAAGGHGQQHGFSRFVRFDHPSPLRAGWRIELRDVAGEEFQVNGPAAAADDPLATRLAILREFSQDRPDAERFRGELAHPALERIQRRLRRTAGFDFVDQHGEAPESPEVTAIVPLYRRLDFLEHQLAHFGRDPDFERVDLVYVLDWPDAPPDFRRLAANLADLHGVPFRLARTSRNVGYALANNLGSELARAERLLLLNSDVIPAEPGWLGRMLAFHAATPDIGALGPKLLFEDDSIQHAGMYFERRAESGIWGNWHYFKGLSRSMMAAAVSRTVPAVTGACMLVDRALYEQVGGLSDSYVEGGYEDSDFCIRLIEAGCHNWYMADVELYHLEAQSYPLDFRVADVYNGWLHTRRWDARIEEIMRAQLEGSDSQLMLVATR